MNIKRIPAIILISVFILSAATGCGASGASIFMKDGSVVNIGNTDPNAAGIEAGDSVSVPGADADTEAPDGTSAGTLTGTPHYTYEGPYDPSLDPYITGGDVSPYYNPDGTAQTSTGATGTTPDATASGADGLIIEVHNDPMHALCDGAQSLRPEEFDALMGKVRQIREIVQ